MDFIGGALPNVMFLVGIIAIGIGLGLEFKIVEVKGNLSRSGRIGILGVGGLLIALSVVLYTRPATTVDTGAPVQAGITGPLSTAAPTVAAPAEVAATVAAPVELVPTAAPAPTAAAAPTAAPAPTAAAAQVRVPDLRDRPLKEAEMLLEAVGLQLGERVPSCDELNVADADVREVKKDRVACQSVQPGQLIAEGEAIDVAVGGGGPPGKHKHGDDDDD